MSALITNEMVDLAAREARAWGVVSKNGEWTNEETQQQCARDILEAVAPLIAAKALRDAADEVCTHSYKSDEVTGVPTSEQVSWLVGTSDAHRMFDRLLKDRAERFEHDAVCPHRRCPGGSLCCCIEASPRGKGGES